MAHPMTTETTKTPPFEVLYNWPEQQVTIRVKDGGVIVLRAQDALRLGSELSNLLGPIYAPIWIAPQ
jgi:hypothetical protein